MLQLVPITSPLHDHDAVAGITASIATRLGERGLAAKLWTEPGAAPGPADTTALLLVTGGTESAALEAAARVADPVILLTHPACNSFPAALEVLARLRQDRRRGRIIMVDDRPEGYTRLAQLLHCIATQQRLGAARLGLFGGPSSWLIASSPEPEGIAPGYRPEIVTIAMDEVLEAIAAAEESDVARWQQQLTDDVERVVEPSAGDLTTAARVYVGLRSLIERHRLDAVSMRCFDLVTDLQTTGCLALAQLTDEGVIAGCEGDLPATITMLWMHYLTGQTPFMANPQDVDLASNTLRIAHCTVARGLVERRTLRSHFESSLGVGIQGELRPGPITLGRIGGANLSELFLSNGELLANEDLPERCRTQVEVSLESPVQELLERPLGNHHVLIEGHWQAQLAEYHQLYA